MNKKKEFHKEIISALLIFKNEMTTLTSESKLIISTAMKKLNEVSRWTLLSPKSFRNIINQRQLACNFNEAVFHHKNQLPFLFNASTKPFKSWELSKYKESSCRDCVNLQKTILKFDIDYKIENVIMFACERHQYSIREILRNRILFEIRHVFENNESMYIFFFKTKFPRRNFKTVQEVWDFQNPGLAYYENKGIFDKLFPNEPEIFEKVQLAEETFHESQATYANNIERFQIEFPNEYSKIWKLNPFPIKKFKSIKEVYENLNPGRIYETDMKYYNSLRNISYNLQIEAKEQFKSIKEAILRAKKTFNDITHEYDTGVANFENQVEIFDKS